MSIGTGNDRMTCHRGLRVYLNKTAGYIIPGCSYCPRRYLQFRITCTAVWSLIGLNWITWYNGIKWINTSESWRCHFRSSHCQRLPTGLFEKQSFTRAKFPIFHVPIFYHNIINTLYPAKLFMGHTIGTHTKFLWTFLSDFSFCHILSLFLSWP